MVVGDVLVGIVLVVLVVYMLAVVACLLAWLLDALGVVDLREIRDCARFKRSVDELLRTEGRK